MLCVVVAVTSIMLDKDVRYCHASFTCYTSIMLHTKQIDAEEASRLFEWLDKKADFRDYALDVFRSEMNPPYMTLPGCTYYLVSANGKGLLLIKAVPKADFLDISF